MLVVLKERRVILNAMLDLKIRDIGVVVSDTLVF